ncbi:hypothetical protein, partial [Mycobacterium lacus]|uniref:hypothetical protein n=1 Tax=Mycobacterium lacus TaxID=169765 RepID=UPI001B803257
RYTYHRGPHLGNSVTAALGNYVTVDTWPRAILNTIAYADLIPVIDGGLTLETFPDGQMRSGSWRAHTLVPGRPCMLCTRQLNQTDIQLDRRGLLDDPTYIERSGRQTAMGAPNVAAYAASVSAALLAQFVSLTAHPGHQGVPAPLRYVLTTHNLHLLEAATGEHCQYELDTAIGDGRTPWGTSESTIAATARGCGRISRTRIARSHRMAPDRAT